jgi:hypothetical protein
VAKIQVALHWQRRSGQFSFRFFRHRSVRLNGELADNKCTWLLMG